MSLSSRYTVVLFIKCVLFCYFCLGSAEGVRKFPDNFLFGVSSAAYQIEGAWNSSGKGESIWDHLTHQRIDLIEDRTNADVACDSFTNYKRDVEMIAELGAKVYRFSISWSRLCPDGICVEFSREGLNYYNDLIDELLKNNIQPAITIFHWDLPQRLQDLGGWTNPIVIQYYEWYARKSFEAFGDRVKMWLTFNEPRDICLLGYGQTYNAPALDFYGIANYLCAENLLKAHAKAYRLYYSDFKEKQKGRVGLTFSIHWYQPADDSPESKKAAEIIRQFEAGIYATPIFGKDGDFPKIVKELVAKRSKEQGYPVSRLPVLDEESIKLIHGSADFFGINHYTTKLAKMAPQELLNSPTPTYEDDSGVVFYQDESWRGSSTSWLKITPWGFNHLLNYVKDTYNNPEVIIFENGYADKGDLNDTTRVEYFREYFNALLDAVDEGCNVTGYMIWTLMDNFEWRLGYTARFGLYHVDFNDPKKTRTPKLSAEYYKKVIKDHGI